jgi:hypothetical protein
MLNWARAVAVGALHVAPMDLTFHPPPTHFFTEETVVAPVSRLCHPLFPTRSVADSVISCSQMPRADRQPLHLNFGKDKEIRNEQGCEWVNIWGEEGLVLTHFYVTEAMVAVV